MTEASNGSQALQSLKEHSRCRLALVDCNMPEMDGQAMVRAVRADLAGQDLCLLMVSAEEDEKLIQQCINAGANGFLRKPFTRAQIEEKLRLLGILP